MLVFVIQSPTNDKVCNASSMDHLRFFQLLGWKKSCELRPKIWIGYFLWYINIKWNNLRKNQLLNNYLLCYVLDHWKSSCLNLDVTTCNQMVRFFIFTLSVLDLIHVWTWMSVNGSEFTLSSSSNNSHQSVQTGRRIPNQIKPDSFAKIKINQLLFKKRVQYTLIK